MPSALAITRSSGVVMKPRTRSALAPDVGGRHADDRDVAARVLAHAQRADRLEPRDQDDEVDDDRQHRPADEEVGEACISVVLGLAGPGLFAGLDLVVDQDRRAVAELERARGHDLLARPRRPRGPRPGRRARRPSFTNCCAHAACSASPSGPFEVRHDEHRVAVGRVVDRRGGQRHDAAAPRRSRTCASTNMPGRSRPPRVGERRLHLRRCAWPRPRPSRPR